MPSASLMQCIVSTNSQIGKSKLRKLADSRIWYYNRENSITTVNCFIHFQANHLKVNCNVTKSGTEYPVEPSMIPHNQQDRTGVHVPVQHSREGLGDKNLKYYKGTPFFLNATWSNLMTSVYHSNENYCSYFHPVSSNHPLISNAPIAMFI